MAKYFCDVMLPRVNDLTLSEGMAEARFPHLENIENNTTMRRKKVFD